MKSRLGFLGVVLVCAGLLVFHQKSKDLTPSSPTLAEIARPLHISSKASSTTKESAFTHRLRKEAELIGRVDSAPENTEERLKNWAQSLSDEQLAELKSVALDLNKSQDERFLAVMMMSWSEKFTALDYLKDIALSEIDPLLSPNRFGEFEKILRFQAVDGMRDLPAAPSTIEKAYSDIVAKTSDSSIADRANRNLWAARGEAPTPAEQDEKALGEVLKGRRRHN